MPAFRIEIDRSLCSGYGLCATSAPSVFHLDDDVLAAARTADCDDPAALDAAASCPMGAITVHAETAAAQPPAA